MNFIKKLGRMQGVFVSLKMITKFTGNTTLKAMIEELKASGMQEILRIQIINTGTEEVWVEWKTGE